VIGCLGGELIELSEVELGKKLVLAGKTDEVVEALGVIERFNDRAHFRAIYDLCDLLGEDLGVGGVEMEKGVLDRLNVGSDLGLGFEEVGIFVQLVAKFALEFVEVVLVGLFKLGFDIDEINDVAVTIAFEGRFTRVSA